jgi:hypothetical protein
MKKLSPEALVGAETLLEQLFPVKRDRPSVKWLKRQQSARVIPFLKIGHFVRYNVADVRAALARRCTVRAR